MARERTWDRESIFPSAAAGKTMGSLLAAGAAFPLGALRLAGVALATPEPSCISILFVVFLCTP